MKRSSSSVGVNKSLGKERQKEWSREQKGNRARERRAKGKSVAIRPDPSTQRSDAAKSRGRIPIWRREATQGRERDQSQ